MGPRKKRAIRCEASERERRGFFPPKMSRLGREVGHRHGDFLRERAVARKTKNGKGPGLRRLATTPVETRIDNDFAAQPGGVHARSDTLDHPGTVRTGNAGKLQPGILAKLDPDIAMIERRRVQAHDRFTRRSRWIGHAGDAEFVDGGKLNGAHDEKDERRAVIFPLHVQMC